MKIAEKYNREKHRLETNRSLDWSTYSIDITIAGEPMKPMTVQTWFDLMLVQSPVIDNTNEITLDAVLDYVWRNSVRYTNKKFLKGWRLFWLHRRICKDLKKTETARDLVTALKYHVQISFEELPESSDGGDIKRNSSITEISSESAMVDEIASRYCMKPSDVLTMPLRQAFALLRVMRVRTLPEYELLEPLSLRKLKLEYLKEINNG